MTTPIVSNKTRYMVEYYDHDEGKWYDASVPVSSIMGIRLIREHYASGGFKTRVRIVKAS